MSAFLPHLLGEVVLAALALSGSEALPHEAAEPCASAVRRSEHRSHIPRQLPHPLLSDQVVDIPEALLEDHDLTVDYILTPTRVIATGCERPKPTGIIWSKVGPVASSGL